MANLLWKLVAAVIAAPAYVPLGATTLKPDLDEGRAELADRLDRAFNPTDEQVAYERTYCVDFRTGKPQVPVPSAAVRNDYAFPSVLLPKVIHLGSKCKS